MGFCACAAVAPAIWSDQDCMNNIISPSSPTEFVHLKPKFEEHEDTGRKLLHILEQELLQVETIPLFLL